MEDSPKLGMQLKDIKQGKWVKVLTGRFRDVEGKIAGSYMMDRQQVVVVEMAYGSIDLMPNELLLLVDENKLT